MNSPASPLGRYTGIQAEATEYYFNTYHAFYLRIIPTSALPSTLKQSTLDSVALKRPRVFTSRSHGVPTSRNKYGAIIYDCSNGSDLDVFAQLFPNGEIWAVSNNGLSRTVQGTLLIPIVPLRKAYEDTLQNLIRLMSDDLGITSPYRIELGVVGINGSKLGLGHRSPGAVSDIIHHGELRIAKILNVIDEDSISEVVQAFIDELYDKSGTTPD